MRPRILALVGSLGSGSYNRRRCILASMNRSLLAASVDECQQ
jgi:type II secretory pathway predicted ATPase ExeA